MAVLTRPQRRFERVSIPRGGGLIATTSAGNWLGAVRILGGGGLLLQSQENFEQGRPYHLHLVDEAAGLAVDVEAVALYSIATGTGFEFKGLKLRAADAIASLIAKYRSSSGAIA